MSEPSSPEPEPNALRDQIIGLGSRSVRKSYYPQLQQQIDELEKARQCAEENERKFRTLFEGISDGVVVGDPETLRVKSVNPAFCKMLGYTEEELLQLSLSDIHPAEVLPRILEGFPRLEAGISLLFEDLPYRRKDGTLIYTDANGTSIDFDNRRCILGVCRDISERKQAREELRQREEWMRHIIQHDPNAITILDSAMRHLFVSDRFLHDYNLADRGEVIGRCVYDVIPEIPEKWKEVHRRCLAGAVERSDDDFFLRPDGSITYNRWECRPWHLANGKIGGIVIYSEVITERKLAEQALLRSEQKYRELVENANSIILRWTPEGVVLYMNEFGLAFFGYAEEELVGKPIVGTIVPERESSGRYILPLIGEIQANPAKYEHNINENIRRNGERAWIAWTNKVVLGADGQVKEILSIGTDITERIRAEEALTREQEFNRALVENLVDAVVACNADFELTLFNRAAREWHGLDILKAPPEQWGDLYHLFLGDGVTPMPRDANPLVRAFRGERLQNEPMVIRAVGQPARYVFTNSASFFDDKGRKLGAVAVLHDITQRKLDEEELLRLNRLYSVLSQVNQAVIHAGSHKELLEEICRVAIKFGAFKMAWIGKIDEETQEVIPVAVEGDAAGYLRTVHIYADARPEGSGPIGTSIREARTYVCNDFHADPCTVPWREAATRSGFRAIVSLPLKNAGKLFGALAVYAGELDCFHAKEVALLEEVASDISFALDHLDQELRRQRDELALKQAKEAAEAANRAKDQFIGVLSHELRTPLTPVLTAVALLKDEREMPAEAQTSVDIIHRNVELEARLIDDLLDVTRISRGIVELHRETVDVHRCLMRTLEICRSEIAHKGLEIALSLRARNHHVLADSARLQQVFWNLLKNAVKFTPEEGRISLRTENAGGRIQIEIADTGIGIEPSLMPRIFNAFEQGEKTWTRRFGGLGLGLSIAKAIVELHGGTVRAFSEGRDKGSVFTVELETSAAGNAETAGKAVSTAIREGKRKILLVEDNRDTLRILSRLLEKWGYAVVGAESVAQALALGERESFDLLISDIGLPDGSGLEIMRRMKEWREVPGIALSGYGTDDDIHQSRAAGFGEHLTKPVGVDRLRDAMERLLSETDQ